MVSSGWSVRSLQPFSRTTSFKSRSESFMSIGRALLLCCVVFAAGCGTDDGPRTVPAEGIVLLDGQPAGEGIAVTFINQSGTSATGLTDKTSRFSLSAFEYKSGALPGSYMAIVNKTELVADKPPPAKNEDAQHAAVGGESVGGGVREVMPKKYTQPNPSWTFTVPENGTTELKLELSSK